MVVLIVAVYACIELREFYPKGCAIREAFKTWQAPFFRSHEQLTRFDNIRADRDGELREARIASELGHPLDTIEHALYPTLEV